MNKKEVEEMIEKCREKATKNYEDGNLKEGKKWEKEMKYFQKLLKDYEQAIKLLLYQDTEGSGTDERSQNHKRIKADFT